MEFVLGVLVGLSVWAITEAIRWARKPWYIPFEERHWSEETRKTLEAAGWAGDRAGWILERMVVQYENQGRTVVTVGRLRREVRSENRDGEAVMMWKKGHAP
jgi:hypothetical protein